MSRYALSLIVAAATAACREPNYPPAPFPMQEGVQEFQVSRTNDELWSRLCFLLNDGSVGCATYRNHNEDFWDLLEPRPLESLSPGPAAHLALDRHGYCFVNVDGGITCEEGRPLDDPAAWQALRGVVGLAAADSRICAWTSSNEILCSTGPAPKTEGKELVKLRGGSFAVDNTFCAVTADGAVVCDKQDAWTQTWLGMLEGQVVVDAVPNNCALMFDGSAQCIESAEIEGRYDQLWGTRRGEAYFVNSKQAVFIDLRPADPVYNLGNWELVDMGMINNSRGTPSYLDHDGLECALVEDTVYCW
jgi:hypothetical protein